MRILVSASLRDCGANPELYSVAKDRSWFSDDYTPFKTVVTDLCGGPMEIIGIGSVNLPVQTSPSQTGPSSQGILRLKTVLHAPGALCNILGKAILDELTWMSIPREDTPGCFINPRNGSWVAYFKPRTQSPLLEVQLSPPPIGPVVGPSPLSVSGHYMIHAFWAGSERRRFQAYRVARRTLRITGSNRSGKEMDEATL